jgi:hypothetical protein
MDLWKHGTDIETPTEFREKAKASPKPNSMDDNIETGRGDEHQCRKA